MREHQAGSVIACVVVFFDSEAAPLCWKAYSSFFVDLLTDIGSQTPKRVSANFKITLESLCWKAFDTGKHHAYYRYGKSREKGHL